MLIRFYHENVCKCRDREGGEEEEEEEEEEKYEADERV